MMSFEEALLLFKTEEEVSREDLLQALKTFVAQEKSNTGQELSRLCALRIIPYIKAQEILRLLQSQVKQSMDYPPIREDYINEST